jgi:hypothetical protein
MLMFKFILQFNDPELNGEEKDKEVQNLLNQFRDLDLCIAHRIPDTHVPENSKAEGSFLVGLLMAEVSFENGKKFISFLYNRLSGKIIELEVEANGKRLKVKANNQSELEHAIAQANLFIGKEL